MLFINCRVHLESNWTKNCVTSNIAGEIAFKITNAKLYAAIIIYQLKTTKIWRKNQMKDLKDLCIGMSIKQK